MVKVQKLFGMLKGSNPLLVKLALWLGCRNQHPMVLGLISDWAVLELPCESNLP